MSDPKIHIETMNDGVKLRIARFEPETAVKAVILMVHGFGEHIGNYHSLGNFFAGHGFAFVIHEQRGFGEIPDLSDKQRKKAWGVISEYNCFLNDITTIRDRIDKWWPNLPVILFGHSMGGNISLNYLIQYKRQNRFDKAIIESPWLRLYKPYPQIITLAARLLGKINGNLAISSNLNIHYITRNLDEVDVLKTDKIFHNRISFKLYTAVADAGEYVINHADKITLPALLLCAGNDKIVNAEAIREFSQKAKDNFTLVEFPDGYHSLHLDIINTNVYKVILDFCS